MNKSQSLLRRKLRQELMKNYENLFINTSHLSSIKNEDSIESLERTLKIQNSQRSRLIINEKSAQDVYKSIDNRTQHDLNNRK